MTEVGVVRAAYDTDARAQVISLEGEFDLSTVDRLELARHLARSRL